jgi:hypothetical protein
MAKKAAAKKQPAKGNLISKAKVSCGKPRKPSKKR